MIEFLAIFFFIKCTNILTRLINRRRDVLHFVSE